LNSRNKSLFKIASIRKAYSRILEVEKRLQKANNSDEVYLKKVKILGNNSANIK
jgi:hypothetical protein